MAESLYDSASMAYAKNPGQLPISLATFQRKINIGSIVIN
jgi:hypothetical protein